MSDQEAAEADQLAPSIGRRLSGRDPASVNSPRDGSSSVRLSVPRLVPSLVRQSFTRFGDYLEQTDRPFVVAALEWTLLYLAMSHFFFHTSTRIGLLSLLFLLTYGTLRFEASNRRISSRGSPQSAVRSRRHVIQLYSHLFFALLLTLSLIWSAFTLYGYHLTPMEHEANLAKLLITCHYVTFHGSLATLLSRLIKYDFTLYKGRLMQLQMIVFLLLLLVTLTTASSWSLQVMASHLFNSFVMHLTIDTQSLTLYARIQRSPYLGSFLHLLFIDLFILFSVTLIAY